MIIPMSQMRSRGSERFINLPEDTQQGRAKASEGWSTFWVTLPPVLANGELPVPPLLKALAPAGCPGAGSPDSTARRVGVWTQSPRRSSPIRLRADIQSPEARLLASCVTASVLSKPRRRQADEEQPIDVWRSAEVSLETGTAPLVWEAHSVRLLPVPQRTRLSHWPRQPWRLTAGATEGVRAGPHHGSVQGEGAHGSPSFKETRLSPGHRSGAVVRNLREGCEQGGVGGRKLQPHADNAGDPQPPGQSSQNHVLRLDRSSSRLKTHIPAHLLPEGQHTRTSHGAVTGQAGGWSGQHSLNQGHTPTEAGLLTAGPTRSPTLSCQDRGVSWRAQVPG